MMENLNICCAGTCSWDSSAGLTLTAIGSQFQTQSFIPIVSEGDIDSGSSPQILSINIDMWRPPFLGRL